MQQNYNISVPAYLRPYTAYVLLMMGGVVTRNMKSKAIAENKRNCCILLELFDYYHTLYIRSKHWYLPTYLPTYQTTEYIQRTTL